MIAQIVNIEWGSSHGDAAGVQWSFTSVVPAAVPFHAISLSVCMHSTNTVDFRTCSRALNLAGRDTCMLFSKEPCQIIKLQDSGRAILAQIHGIAPRNSTKKRVSSMEKELLVAYTKLTALGFSDKNGRHSFGSSVTME